MRDPPTEKITGFDFIFSVPPGLGQIAPRSLRSLFLDEKIKYPLNECFGLAVSLARSIVFLYSSSFVYKNISLENIIVLQLLLNRLRTPYLIGFERFRLAEGRIYMSGDAL